MGCCFYFFCFFFTFLKHYRSAIQFVRSQSTRLPPVETFKKYYGINTTIYRKFIGIYSVLLVADILTNDKKGRKMYFSTKIRKIILYYVFLTYYLQYIAFILPELKRDMRHNFIITLKIFSINIFQLTLIINFKSIEHLWYSSRVDY